MNEQPDYYMIFIWIKIVDYLKILKLFSHIHDEDVWMGILQDNMEDICTRALNRCRWLFNIVRSVFISISSLILIDLISWFFN